MSTLCFWYFVIGILVGSAMLATMLISERIREVEGKRSDIPEAQIPLWVCLLTIPLWPFTLAKIIQGYREG